MNRSQAHRRIAGIAASITWVIAFTWVNRRARGLTHPLPT
jgi:hypothetical protein